jgi:hypothetical protein
MGQQNNNPNASANQQWVHIDISALAYNDHLVGDYFHHSKKNLININTFRMLVGPFFVWEQCFLT